MFSIRVAATVIVAATALFVTADAMAQNYNPRTALSSRLGATSCSQFSGLSRTARADIVRRMVRSAPPQSLAGLTVSRNFKKSGDQPVGDIGNGATVPGTPLTAGELIAACQAVPGHTTLRDAYSHFNSSSNVLSNRRR